MSARAFEVRPGVIAVNGIEIPRDEIAREAQHHPASSPFESWRAAARALVIRALLLQEAEREGLLPEPVADGGGRREADDEALIRQLIDRKITVAEPDEDTCRRYYEQNRKRFRSAPLHEAAHILIAAAPDDAEARAAAKAKAAALITELQSSPGEFATAAAWHSACPSAAQGGNLGQIGPGQTVPAFEAALATLEEGAITPEPVETRYGFHVIRLDRRISGRDLPFEAVEARIAAYLGERAHHDALYSFVRWLAVHAQISGIDIETGKIDPAAIMPAPEGATVAAMRRFANGASAEDWTSLIGSVQKADDPAAALATGMESWKPQKPAPERTRPVFTYRGNG
jgi:peptidyl-prolyl cis-trans isomerase C